MREPLTPMFEDAVGAQLLSAVLQPQPQTLIKERHDSLEFLNHVYLRHHVRVVVAVDRLPGSVTGEIETEVLAPHGVPSPFLRTWQGRLVVPLTSLDRHSRTTTHVTNESGDLVPLFTTHDLSILFGGGLVSFANQILKRPVQAALDPVLRQIPWKASRLEPAGAEPQAAAEASFDDAYSDVISVVPDGRALVRTPEFYAALRVVTGGVPLVVELNPDKGPTRILSYRYVRRLELDPRAEPTEAATNPVHRVWKKIHHFKNNAGTAPMSIALGPVDECERYQLEADAPFDTWFAQADIKSIGAKTPEEVDTSQRFRLTYTKTSHEILRSPELTIDLRAVFTGVARTSVFASAFLAICCVLGTIRVITNSDHVFLDSDTDAGASLLLLFPGVVASLLASSARHTLTATVQFPMRFTLLCMSLVSFALAAATAVRASGVWNMILWMTVTVVTCLVAYVLWQRGKELAD